MNTLAVYRCLCDETRLRILNLLLEGPLCVCHLASVLGMEQPKISRHLKALKEAGAVETERCYNWTICRIATKPSKLLDTNLRCLQDLRNENPLFRDDLKCRTKAVAEINSTDCTEVPARVRNLCQKGGRSDC